MCIESKKHWIIHPLEYGRFSVDLHFLIGDGYPLPNADGDVRAYLQSIAGAFPTPKDCVSQAEKHFAAEQIKAFEALAAKAGPEIDEVYRLAQCLAQLHYRGDEYVDELRKHAAATSRPTIPSLGTVVVSAA